MEYEKFISRILAELSDVYKDSATVVLDHRKCNNQVEIDSITIRTEQYNIAPTIQLNPYYGRYLEGVPFEDILLDIQKTYELIAPQENFNIGEFLDYQKAKEHIVFRLINFEQNQEILLSMPYIPFLDLAITFSYQVPSDLDTNASIQIRNEHINHWKITKEELYQVAMHNTPLIFPISVTPMSELLGNPQFSNACHVANVPDMYIVTNKSKIYGAAAILYPGILEKFSQIFHSSLTIIPSSIHETLIIPEEDLDYNHLCELITSVNEMELQTVDILSSHPYIFDQKELKLTA